MRALTVLYDGLCPLCERCRHFLESARQRIPLRVIDCHSAEARQRFGRIPGLGRELVAIDDEGQYWIGPAAFVMCLWALEPFAAIAALMLWSPVRPITIALFGWISENRRTIGAWTGAPPCSGAHCGVADGHAGPYR